MSFLRYGMTPVIHSIETILVDLPTVRPHKLAMATVSEQTLAIVRMRCADGIEGIGEVATIGGLSYGVDSPESIQVAIENYLAPLLVGESSANVNRIRARMARHVRGNYFAKSALEMALLDAQGKRLGLSISALLGGAQNTHLPVLWTLGNGDVNQDVEEARRLMEEERHHQFKIKVGSNDVQTDVARIVAVSQELPSSCSLRVDVNQAWTESEARPAIATLENAGIDLVEQPVSARNIGALARLSQRFDIALMADEAVTDTGDGVDLIKADFIGAVAIKVAKAGGIMGALELAHAAQAAGLDIYGGTMLEGTIGTAAGVHAWSTLSGLRWGTEMFGPLLLADDIVVETLTYTAGGVIVPTAPGLGVAIDEDKLAEYRRDGRGHRKAVFMPQNCKGGSDAVQG